MQPIKPLKEIKGKEKERIISQLKEEFGIEELSGKLYQRGEGKLYLFQGDYSEKEVEKINRLTFIERIGVYLGKIEEHGIRLSIEGSQILKPQIKKNVVELNEEEMLKWMMGYEVEKESGLRGYVIIKYKEDMLGTGKASEKKITNFIPKSRRLKDKNVE